jgi:dUTP pyrophosphatase
MIVKFKKKDEFSKLPVKGSLFAAAHDAYAHSITVREDGKIVVGLGFSTDIPIGYKGILVPRSNLTKYNWVLNNSFGVIDADYRGEWMAVFTPIQIGSIVPEFPYELNDRVCQLFFEPVLTFEMQEVNDLTSTDRGNGGFGSTGVK